MRGIDRNENEQLKITNSQRICIYATEKPSNVRQDAKNEQRVAGNDEDEENDR